MIARSRPENVRASYISQFANAAKAASPAVEIEEEDQEDQEDQEEKPDAPEDTEEVKEAKRKVVKDLVASVRAPFRIEATDKEFEGLSNLVLSLVLSLFPSTHNDFATLLLSFVDSLSAHVDNQGTARLANPTLSTRYASIATLFNSLPLPLPASATTSTTPSTLRLAVLLKLVAFASANDDFSVIRPVLLRLEAWLIEWGFGLGTPGEEEGNAAINNIVKALVSKGKLNEARSILLSHLSTPSASKGTSYTPSSSASLLSSRLIVLSLGQNDVFDFSTLASLVTPSEPALKELLTIFQSGDVEAFEKFAVGNEKVLTEQGLEKSQLERKLKLLALAELCSKKVGEFVSYEAIAKALRLSSSANDDGEEVETWVIDGASSIPFFPLSAAPLISPCPKRSHPSVPCLRTTLANPPLLPRHTCFSPNLHAGALVPTSRSS